MLVAVFTLIVRELEKVAKTEGINSFNVELVLLII